MGKIAKTIKVYGQFRVKLMKFAPKYHFAKGVEL